MQHFEPINESGLYQKFLRDGISQLKIRSNIKVLDAGCGFAYWSFNLIGWLNMKYPELKDSISITAFDYIEDVLITAKEKYGFQAESDLQSGLSETVQWFCTHRRFILENEADWAVPSEQHPATQALSN